MQTMQALVQDLIRWHPSQWRSDTAETGDDPQKHIGDASGQHSLHYYCLFHHWSPTFFSSHDTHMLCHIVSALQH